jgi:N-acetyl sugar amidotransferase
MSELIYCKKCVISNYRPSSVVEFQNKPKDLKPYIEFKNGICSACSFREIKETIDWDARREELEVLCEKFRSKNNKYDCIIPGSGGKDSGFTSHYLKNELGMNPLTVTWAPHIYTESGWKNFQAWIDVGGFDNYLIHPNGSIHRLLSKLAFEKLGHAFQPFIIGQKMVGPRMSTLHDIPLVFYGENQAEYGNNIEDNYSPLMDNKFYSTKYVNEEVTDFYLSGYPENELVEKFNIEPKYLEIYKPLNQKDVVNTGTEVHYLGYYYKWDPQEMYYYSVENTGFRANNTRTQGSYSKYAGIDDKIDWLHYYMTVIKFGIGRATYDASQEIRNNKITREEGIALVQKYDDEFPEVYFQEILDYLNIDKKKFWEIVDNFRNPLFWQKKDGGDWEKINTISC